MEMLGSSLLRRALTRQKNYSCVTTCHRINFAALGQTIWVLTIYAVLPLGMGERVTPKTCYYPHSVTVPNFITNIVQAVYEQAGVPKFFWGMLGTCPIGMWACMTLQQYFTPICVNAKFSRSRSLEPTRIGQLPLTSCQFFVVTMAVSRTIFKKRGKYDNFPTPVHLAPQLRGFPLEFCNGGGVEKNGMIPLAECQRNVTTFPFIHAQYQHWTDRQTDRQTDFLLDGRNWYNNILRPGHK